jgi:hypothetical protein
MPVLHLRELTDKAADVSIVVFKALLKADLAARIPAQGL